MDCIDQLFAKKTREAAEIVAAKPTRIKTEPETGLPFEVNKVIAKIDELTEKRKKLFKKK